MSGKASLILVMGFTAIFLTMGFFWGSLSSRSVDNSLSYYKRSIARNIAVSGANMGVSEVLRDSNWASDISNKDFENGKMTVTITGLGPSYRTLASVGSFMGFDHTVKVKLLRDSKLRAEYAWFIPSVSTGSVNRPWITGDSVWGGFHSNQFLVVDGDPVFFGKVTTLKGIQDQSKGDPSNPEFKGGYEEGIDVSWSKAVVNFGAQEQAAQTGKDEGGNCLFNKNLWLAFNANGTVTYRTALVPNARDDSSKYSAPVTVSLSQMAPTGIIFVKGADVFLSGTLKGEVTVVAEGSSGGGNGNVYLAGDITYSVDPMIPNGSGGFEPNPDATDMMGIIADNNLIIATSQVSGGKANNVDNPDIHIDAAILCVQGGMQVQNLGSSPANIPMGNMYLQGSMTAGKEEVVAQFDGNTVTAGYNRNVIYDGRFSNTPPKYFPLSSYYRVVSWLE